MEQQVNLYQPIMGAEKRLFSSAAIALGLGVLMLCLAALAAFASWRTTRIERSVATLERQQSAQLALSEHAAAAMHPQQTLEQLQAHAREVAAAIAARQHALDVVRLGAHTGEAGYAAQLEALARRQTDGVWLKGVMLGSGDSRLGLQGRATNPRLVPAYLAALQQEHALDGVRFDRLSIRRAKKEEAPADVAFELTAPGLHFEDTEKHP